MKQQQGHSEGFMFIILMLILSYACAAFSLCKAGTDGNSPGIEQILGSGNVAEAVISKSPDTKRICDSYTGKWPDSPPERI